MATGIPEGFRFGAPWKGCRERRGSDNPATPCLRSSAETFCSKFSVIVCGRRGSEEATLRARRAAISTPHVPPFPCYGGGGRDASNCARHHPLQSETQRVPGTPSASFVQRGERLGWPSLRASGEHTIHPCPERSILCARRASTKGSPAAPPLFLVRGARAREAPGRPAAITTPLAPDTCQTLPSAPRRSRPRWPGPSPRRSNRASDSHLPLRPPAGPAGCRPF